MKVSDQAVSSQIQLKTLRASLNDSPALADSVRRIKRWQSSRLAKTYPDLMGNPGTAQAARFFLDDLYGDHDLSDRDQALERVLPKVGKILPSAAMQVVLVAIELDLLSEQMDHRLAEALLDAGVENDALLTESLYAEYFVAETKQSDRLKQLELLNQVGQSLCKLVKVPLMGWILKKVEKPAVSAGLGALHRFVVNGFDAFASLDDAKNFLSTIEQRERYFLEKLYSGERMPYQSFIKSLKTHSI